MIIRCDMTRRDGNRRSFHKIKYVVPSCTKFGLCAQGAAIPISQGKLEQTPDRGEVVGQNVYAIAVPVRGVVWVDAARANACNGDRSIEEEEPPCVADTRPACARVAAYVDGEVEDGVPSSIRIRQGFKL